MIRGIENGFMITDLDAKLHRILNPGVVHAPNLVETDDPRMSDKRLPIDGSVTDLSVAEDAAIDQSKLDLTDTAPLNYLGTTSDKAAPGDVTLYQSDKGANFGYAGLNGQSKLISGTVTLSGTGTLTDIDFEFPFFETMTVQDSSGTDRTFTLYWSGQSPYSFLGNMSGASGQPSFFNPTGFTLALIPDFDASNITTEELNIDQLPVVQGVGPDHSAGIIPMGPNDVGIGEDYFARDATFRPMQSPASYQPQIPAPAITLQSYFGDAAYINLSEIVPGANLFYRTGTDVFIEATKLPLLIAVNVDIDAYAAKDGYDNSAVSSFTVPPTPTG